MNKELVAELRPIYNILEVNNRLLVNVLDGIEESQRHARPDKNVNHAAWIAGHVVSTRFFITYQLGVMLDEPYPELFRAGPTIQEDMEYPELQEQLKYWNAVNAELEKTVEHVTREQLLAPPPGRFPGSDNTVLGAISFFVHHECYHLGQLGMLRKMLGLPAMKYY